MLVGPDPRGLSPVIATDTLAHFERRQAILFPGLEGRKEQTQR